MVYFSFVCLFVETYFEQYVANLRIKCVTGTNNVSVLFYKNLKSSFYMTLTFDSEVSLHYWFLWPRVRRATFHAARSLGYFCFLRRIYKLKAAAL